jgi:thiosulfate/3-mercaptopyruvate sulfurtransferase
MTVGIASMLPPSVHCGMTPWISADDLRARLADPDLRLVDVRFTLGSPDAGRLAYAAGHLPGATYLDLETDLSAPVRRHGGRHPLPDPDRLAASLGGVGIGRGAWVVAYDAGDGMLAGRLWWMLRWLGHDRVQVLDGGLAAWIEAGGELDDTIPTPVPGSFVPRPRPEMVVDRDWLRARLEDPSVTVVDARAPERYRGDVEPLDPRAGHVPGAINLPYAGNLAGGRFRPVDELAARYAPLAAAGTVVVYCGSGVSAAHDLMALEAVGVRGARLYPGSWSDWVSYEDAPIAVGPEPGPD